MQNLDCPRVPLEFVVLEHIASACQFLGEINGTAFGSRDLQAVQNQCYRCEAHLDALRIAGQNALILGQAAMGDDGQVASVLALLLAESEKAPSATSAQAVALLHHESPEIRQAAWWGLRLASSKHVEPHLRGLIGKPKWDFASAAALDILAFHRLPVQEVIDAQQDDGDEEIAWLLAEAGGRIPGLWNVTHLETFLRHSSQRVRVAALRASARCGLHPLTDICRQAVSLQKSSEAISFLGIVGSPEDLQLLRVAVGSPATAEASLKGLGRLGLPESVPFLLEVMQSPALAESAAKAFWRITGQKVDRGPAPEPPPELTEEELDFWEPQSPIDLPRTREWWANNAARFTPAKRYQVGLNVSDDPLGPVFDQLPLGIRYDVFLRERALTPGTPDWELETWTWKQRTPGA